MIEVEFPEPDYPFGTKGMLCENAYSAETMKAYADKKVVEALRHAKRIVMDGPLYIDLANEMPYFEESCKAMSVTVHSQLCKFEKECFAKDKP